MEAAVRAGVFLGVIIGMLLWEFACPRRALSWPRRARWMPNLGLTLLNTALVRTTVGGAAYAAALFAVDQGIGLSHWFSCPAWVTAIMTLLVLDFAIYLQHVMFHAVPLFWRLHRVHHADPDFDATTGLRFHPLEIMLSLGFKASVVLLIGAVPWAVIAFEVILNTASVFNHGNVAIPESVDRWLRRVVVTPDMHRVHHSTRIVETNSNFGFSVSCWDRLCGTYRAQPALGHTEMVIGLSEYPTPFNLGQLLLLPFQGSAGQYTYAGSRSTDV